MFVGLRLTKRDQKMRTHWDCNLKQEIMRWRLKN